ncbi:hypothetical protein SMD20_40365 [Nonomuraea sp. LP-02]|uniref:hypothetical protein n=1 Tax=Nonomuraea sp. LP-02 TaxID=3097960 RepID=UPI002E3747FD|nr:hypothetical protein [Nonomuraea sp. LP-02]MED7930535.1 hypothetical protein [Nonomuraea sp. LP-02]
MLKLWGRARVRRARWRCRHLREVGILLERFRQFWSRRLDALGAELARARRERRHSLGETPSPEGRPGANDEEEEDE